MTIPQSVFAARYKVACFYIANHLFETLIENSPELDLTSLKHLQRDGGFFLSSQRLVEQLTAFTSEHELEEVKKKIEASGTMYFKKSILTAVVKQGAVVTTKPMSDDDNNDPKLENLYDKFLVKKLYDSYFSAYVDDSEPLEFLDKPTKQQNDFVSIFELGVFDSEVLSTISGILDFTDKTACLEVIDKLKTIPRYETYKQFFSLVSKCL